jgi:hypothetical protein
MKTLLYAILAALLIGPVSAIHAQVMVVSAPKEPSLLTMTRDWSRASTLGDLREIDLRSEDIEVRACGGYGLTSTEATVLRRDNGEWSARRAWLVNCTLHVPIPVGDTASELTMQQFVAEARRDCGGTRGDVSRGALVISADTLGVEALTASSAAIDSVWNTAVLAGLFALPSHVERKWMMVDGFTYVIEVRQGNLYRAVEIEHLEHPEVAADSVVKQVYAALAAVPGFAKRRGR